MDRRLRRAPDSEWVLMYRSGLSRAGIAALVGVPPAAIGYHLAIARRQDPGLEAEHRAAAGAAPAPGPSPAELARTEPSAPDSSSSPADTSTRRSLRSSSRR